VKGFVMLRQRFLPDFPEGSLRIGEMLSILEKEGRTTYFVGGDNYYSHRTEDMQSRRFALASLMENRHVRARDLTASPLCIPHRTLMNWSGQLRKDGASSFFQPPQPQKPRIMTDSVIAECAQLIADGLSVAKVARGVGIEESTLRKAIKREAVPKKLRESNASAELPATIPTNKTDRSRADAEAATGMGTACTRADERMAAAIGLAASATARFEPCCDVSLGGMLTGLPALCANGLLSGIDKHLKLPNGFYSCLHILMMLGFMALGRIRRPENLRHVAPGEFGKVIGLDRVPEVRTLREKITIMASTGTPNAWMKELSKSWMEDDPDEAGYLYVDGHVRVYNGNQALLPRRFVSRERLCLRGTTDYWVNDAIGRPFFVVSKAVTDGLAEALIKDIVPELLRTVPNQPSKQELNNDASLHRFVVVFDREGATHALLAALWGKRIGAITYRKNVKDVWSESEFKDTEVPVPGGGETRMKLATRQTTITAGEASLAVIEVRRLTDTGHQTAIISTAQRLANSIIAGRMFSRWCQENFFAYMMEHYDIDGLVQYGAESLPGTVLVVNPVWRENDKAVKKALVALRKLEAKLGAIDGLNDGTEIQKKAEYVLDIQNSQDTLKLLRAKRKETEKKVTIDSLPKEQQPTQLLPLNKMLTDTVKMIAYRSETALVAILRRHLKKEDEARALVRELFVSSADIEPNDAAGTLTIRIHRMASPVHDRAIAALLEDLTKLEFCHPETRAIMIFTLI
jgi:hypothetical protein